MSDALQEFVYAVSHDFGRPLRHIIAFGDLLREKHSAEFDEESSEWLAYLIRAGREADLMLERLAHYSRLATHELSTSKVDVRTCCEAMRNVFAKSHPNRVQDLEIAASGVVVTDEALLSHALVELVENALVYGGNGPIQVVVHPTEMGLSAMICDRGPGIPDTQIDHVMKPFGRLHAEDSAHVGLGLNCCSRALERLGATLRLSTTGPGLKAVFEIETTTHA